MGESINDLVLRVKVTGDETLRQLQTNLKNVKQARMDVALGSDDDKKLIQAQKDLNLAVKQGGANYDEYLKHVRTARVEKRALNFAIVELMHGFEGLSTAFGQLSGASDQSVESSKRTIQSFQSAAGAGLGVKFALDMMGSGFAAIATPVAVAITALTMFGSAAAEDKKNQKDLNEAMADGIELMREGGRVSDEQYRKALRNRLEELRAERETASDKMTDNTLSGKLSRWWSGVNLGNLANAERIEQNADIKAQTQLQTLDNQIQKLENRLSTFNDESAKKQNKAFVDELQALGEQVELKQMALSQELDAVVALEKKAKTQDELNTLLKEEFRIATEIHNQQSSPKFGIAEIGLGSSTVKAGGKAGLTEREAADASLLMKTQKPIQAMQSQFNSSMDNMYSVGRQTAQNISNSFQDYMDQGFARIVQGGKVSMDELFNYILSQLAGSILPILANALSAGATGNIFSAFGAMFSHPTVPVGGSVAGGPNVSQQVNQLVNAIGNMSFKLQGQDLVLAVQKSTIARNGRTM